MSPYHCPSCQRVFDTERGLRVHHARTHDEILPNRTCATCGEAFYREHSRLELRWRAGVEPRRR